MKNIGSLMGIAAVLVAALLGTLLSMCEPAGRLPGTSDGDTDGDSDSDVDGEIIPPGNDSGIMPTPKCQANCTDFPAGVIFDTGVGTNAADFFGPDKDSFQLGPFCVTEPQLGSFEPGQIPGSLFPANWLTPRFRINTTGGENLFEIRIAAQKEINDIVIYTIKNPYTLPVEIWNIIRTRVIDQPLTVTVRGVNMAVPGVVFGMRGDMMIAPIRAGGQMLYWATNSSNVTPDSSKLVSLIVDNPYRVDALTVLQVGDRHVIAEGGSSLRQAQDDRVPDGFVECIGCHVATPDGKAVSFNDHWPWNIVLASVDTVDQEVPVGAQPTYVTPGAQVIMNQPWLGTQTFSSAHWNDSEKIMIAGFTPRTTSTGTNVGWVTKAPYPSTTDQLIWIDLLTPFAFTGADPPNVGTLNTEMLQALNSGAFGFIQTNESWSIVTPDWSSNGQTIVYTAATKTQDGRISEEVQESDIHLVDYNNRQGGQVRVLNGAADPNYFEYYPSFSADNQLIAFNRSAKDNKVVYYRPSSEVFVVPTGGADASTGNVPIRLTANDPPACYSGPANSSPGVFNSWPKWSPSVISTTEVNFPPARTYYFLIFSSARFYPEQIIIEPNQYSPDDTRSSQLYMTTIVRDKTTGTYTTYPAIYLWNQDTSYSNLTPAWEDFKIAPILK